MSAATDKARFFLEQSVPELKEYERKNIFNKVGYRGAVDVASAIAHMSTTRMKSSQLSRNDRTLSTSSTLAAPHLSTLSDMSNTK